MSKEGSGPTLPESPQKQERKSSSADKTKDSVPRKTSSGSSSSSKHARRKSLHVPSSSGSSTSQDKDASTATGESNPPGDSTDTAPPPHYHHEKSSSGESKHRSQSSSSKTKPSSSSSVEKSPSKHKQSGSEEDKAVKSSSSVEVAPRRSSRSSTRPVDRSLLTSSSGSSLAAPTSTGSTPGHTPGHSPTRHTSKLSGSEGADKRGNNTTRSESDASSVDESEETTEDAFMGEESDVSKGDSGKGNNSSKSGGSAQSDKATPNIPTLTPVQAKKKRFPAILGGGRNLSFAGPNDPVVYIKQRPMAGLFIQKQGVMLKKSQKTGRWKKRYVVVTPTQLCCFKDAADSGDPEMSIDLQYAVVRPRVTHDLKPGFDVVSTDGTLSLMAMDSVTTQEWFAHISSVIEHLVEASAATAGGVGASSASGNDEEQHDDESGPGSAQDKNKEALIELLARPENHLCADCSRPDPQWASTNLGSFVCITCSGIHRGLGVHITKIRSVSMDTWTDEQVAVMASKGNEKVNEYYLATLPDDVKVPTPETPIEELKQFLRDKYVLLKYIPEEDKGKVPQYATSVPTLNISQSYISSDDVFHQKSKSGSVSFPNQSQNSGRRTLTLDQHLMFMAAIRDDVVFRAELQRFIFQADDGQVFKRTLLNAIQQDETFKENLKKALLE